MERKNGFQGREKRVSGQSGPVRKRGDGLNLGGPVGNAEGFGGPEKSGQQAGQRGLLGLFAGAAGAGGGGLKKLLPLIVAVVVLLGGGGGLGSVLGLFGGGTGVSQDHSLLENLLAGGGQDDAESWSVGGGSYAGLEGYGQEAQATAPVTSAVVNTAVAPGARAKRTRLLGGGQDSVTVMVYMCGADLESKYGMATADMQEMAAADLGSRVNLLVYTGGCTQWKNSVVSSRTNQIYQVKEGGLSLLEDNVGPKPMTDSDTLGEYIRWGTRNFPANRNILIFWDHGGGSTGGYGHDELHPDSGSMSLDKIDRALQAGGAVFDFIGFDACLMATLENATMLSRYADYLIASEETEPGIGWHYTGWLTELARDPGADTLSIGKRIVDDFTEMCAQKAPGDQTTLSVIDLGEVEGVVPQSLTAFAKSTGEMIRSQNFQAVSEARGKTKEFARSVGIDQVDLIHLADNMKTAEGQALSQALRSCVKYNRASRGVGQAYGLSIYFPYGKLSSMDKMVDTYAKIGMDSEYTKCIESFASLETGGQAAGGGASGSMNSLFGMLMGQGQPSGGGSMLGQLLGGQGLQGISGLLGESAGFLDGRLLEDSRAYLEGNQLAPQSLVWKEKNGEPVLELEEKQWDLIQDVELNVFVDDGKGFIDLGLDNVYSFNGQGDLRGDYDGTWLALDGQVVAYYLVSSQSEGDSYRITGRVPAFLNGQLVDLMLVFTDENPSGTVAGARLRYDEEQVKTQAKGLIPLQTGDRLDFVCDYYTYDKEFVNNYYLGQQMTVAGQPEISNLRLSGSGCIAAYRLTDIYQNHYWTPQIG